MNHSVDCFCFCFPKLSTAMFWVPSLLPEFCYTLSKVKSISYFLELEQDFVTVSINKLQQCDFQVQIIKEIKILPLSLSLSLFFLSFSPSISHCWFLKLTCCEEAQVTWRFYIQVFWPKDPANFSVLTPAPTSRVSNSLNDFSPYLLSCSS